MATGSRGSSDAVARGCRPVWGVDSVEQPLLKPLLAGLLPGHALDGSSLLVLFEAVRDSVGDRVMSGVWLVSLGLSKQVLWRQEGQTQLPIAGCCSLREMLVLSKHQPIQKQFCRGMGFPSKGETVKTKMQRGLCWENPDELVLQKVSASSTLCLGSRNEGHSGRFQAKKYPHSSLTFQPWL